MTVRGSGTGRGDPPREKTPTHNDEFGAPASCNGAAAGTVVESYFAGAAPQNTGFRYFGTNQGGIIYTARVVVPVTQFGAAAGAVPIQ